MFYNSCRSESPGDKKVLRGRNITKFVVNEGKTFLRENWKEIETFQKLSDPKTRIKVNIKAYEEEIKILVRQTSDQIIGTIDESKYYHQKSLLSVHLKSEASISIFYILGILNSDIVSILYQELAGERSQAFAQVKKNKLQQVLIPINHNRNIEDRITKISFNLTKINNENHDEYYLLLKELNSLANQLYSDYISKHAA